jgi:hypothetical protein
VLDAESVVANWAKWCLDNSGIYPHCPTNWEQFDYIPYKNGDASAEEKLEELERRLPADDRWAERCELWVNQLDALYRTAIRVHHVGMPEGRRHDRAIVPDREVWQVWRANETRRLLREQGHPQKLDVEAYEAAVNEAMRQIGEFLIMWARGV